MQSTFTELSSNTDFLATATGPVTIPMTNDFLFKTFLQRNNKALKGLISSLLHTPIEQIKSVEVLSALDEGDYLTDKTVIMDILVSFNNNSLINLEMQVINEHNWPERSLTYLCRTFNHLNQGDHYSQIRSVIQIGFLDFTLFPNSPEFYATYKIMNEKTHEIYSSKFVLSVINLTCINLATEEDKQFQIDYWASLFKSTTWEEIKMLAEKNEYIKEAADTIFQLTRDQQIRRQLEAREDFLRREREKQWRWETVTKQYAELQTEYADLKTENTDLKAENTDLKTENTDLKSKVAELEALLAARTN